jgi:hypothetical protein
LLKSRYATVVIAGARCVLLGCLSPFRHANVTTTAYSAT